MGLNHNNQEYWKFTGPQRLDKEIHTIGGLLCGIAIDGVVTDSEIAALRAWIHENITFQNRHPFNEIIPALEEALSDDVLDEEEIEDILWLCESLTKDDRFFSQVTSDMQRLQAIMGGIIADGSVTKEELTGLSSWMEEHQHLRSCWPYDEIESVIMSVLSDGVIDDREHETLLTFFGEFINTRGHKAIDIPENWEVSEIKGICAVCPEIEFSERMFCFTGKSERSTRENLKDLVEQLGGSFSKRLAKTTDYLIVGADGNPCWAYACYGRKVEEAVEYRKKGQNILIVHEYDFWDSVEDL